MENVKLTMSQKNIQSLNDSFDDAMKTSEFSNLVKNLKISKEVGRKYTSKILDTVK